MNSTQCLRQIIWNSVSFIFRIHMFVDSIGILVLVACLEHVICFHILKIIIPIDFYIFQRVSNQQPDLYLFISLCIYPCIGNSNPSWLFFSRGVDVPPTSVAEMYSFSPQARHLDMNRPGLRRLCGGHAPTFQSLRWSWVKSNWYTCIRYIYIYIHIFPW